MDNLDLVLGARPADVSRAGTLLGPPILMGRILNGNEQESSAELKGIIILAVWSGLGEHP
mgnify:CR=1 FL=1